MHGSWMWWAYYLLHRAVGVAVAVLVAYFLHRLLKRVGR